jgi:hypothetical protein
MIKHIWQRCLIGLFAILLVSLGLSGCSAQSKIQGAWINRTNTDLPSGVAMGKITVYKFQPDNTLMISKLVTAFGQSGSGAGTVGIGNLVSGARSADLLGTYQIDGQTVHCAITQLTTQSSAMLNQPAQPEKIAPLQIKVDYSWSMKDSNTLDLTVASATGENAAESFPPGSTLELNKHLPTPALP